MRFITLCLVLILSPLSAAAQTDADIARAAVQDHILPRVGALAKTGDALETAAKADCAPDSAALRAAYNAAFDAWISASHLRFGPSEKNDRAFALAFWPDTRGITPRTLRSLIAAADPVADNADAFAAVSIAGRGFFALEYMLYDPDMQALGDAGYRCKLVRVMAADIANLDDGIAADWTGGYADKMLHPGPDSPYRSDGEVVQELFKALTYGLEFTADTRLGRPLGTFDKPRPKRAEAWRSGRSLRDVVLSLTSLRDLADILAQRDPALVAKLDKRFQKALNDANDLDDPALAGVADPLKRLRIESLQESVQLVRETVRDELGPTLGVASGFNALDGD